MDGSPLITAIIPTYKRPQRLKKAIESVLNQTFPLFEVWIFDNHSGDETEEVVWTFQKSDPRVHYCKHKVNIGAVANFNFGLKQVCTPFFSFLSDDDVLLPTFYETSLTVFKKFPQAGFVCGSVILANESGTVINVTTLSWKEREYYEPPDGLFEMIHIQNLLEEIF